MGSAAAARLGPPLAGDGHHGAALVALEPVLIGSLCYYVLPECLICLLVALESFG